MNKKLLAALSKLMKIDENGIVTALNTDDGDDSLVSKFITDHNIYTSAEQEDLLKNSNKTYLESGDWEPSQLPTTTFKKVAAVALRKKEEALAKKHNITDFKDLDDLTDKIVASLKGKGGDDATAETITKLRETVAKLELEKTEAVKAVEEKYTSQILGKESDSAFEALVLDVADDKIKGSKNLLKTAFHASNKIATDKDGKTIVLGSDGKPHLDRLGNPKTFSDVLSSFVTEAGYTIKTVADGGRGAGDSGIKPNLKGISWEDYKKSKGITTVGVDDSTDALYDEWKAGQQTT